MQDEGFGCFKRPDKQFAQCRPHKLHMDENGVCHDSNYWLCPASWMGYGPGTREATISRPPTSCSDPSKPFQECTLNNCCMDGDNFGCFKRPEHHYAQCRPHAYHLGKTGECEDTEEWLCPSWAETTGLRTFHDRAAHRLLFPVTDNVHIASQANRGRVALLQIPGMVLGLHLPAMRKNSPTPTIGICKQQLAWLS